MDYQSVLDKYYPEKNNLKKILEIHSHQVTNKCLSLARLHPELQLNLMFLEEAAMLHDIGIFLTNAPGIYCFGSKPYLCHGVLGADLLRKEGFPLHARVCERHTGAGLSLKDIKEQQLPIPSVDLLPESLEEQLICFSDKFFSKTNLYHEKTVEEARHSVAKFAGEGIVRFDGWIKKFL